MKATDMKVGQIVRFTQGYCKNVQAEILEIKTLERWNKTLVYAGMSGVHFGVGDTMMYFAPDFFEIVR